jgi:hypothetical protein
LDCDNDFGVVYHIIRKAQFVIIEVDKHKLGAPLLNESREEGETE